jgi:hypothetical protein
MVNMRPKRLLEFMTISSTAKVQGRIRIAPFPARVRVFESDPDMTDTNRA